MSTNDVYMSRRNSNNHLIIETKTKLPKLF